LDFLFGCAQGGLLAARFRALADRATTGFAAGDKGMSPYRQERQENMPTLLSPTAGYIYNVAPGAEPGPRSEAERQYLRRLAEQVAEIAAEPWQEEKRNLWYRHNGLEPVRPMLLVFPEDSWEEIIGEDQLEVEPRFWRQWEWYLKHLLYRHRHIPDDFVVEPTLYVPRVVRQGGWGLTSGWLAPSRAKGAGKVDPALQNPADIDQLTYPTIEVDEAATQRTFEAVGEVFGDLLSVRFHCSPPMVNLIGEATWLRGTTQVMLDMYERPAWLHQLMGFLAEGLLRITRYLEGNGYLTLNNGHHYTDSGGIGYTKDLPAADFDGQRVRLCDLWGFGVAQEMDGIGPQQHEEFLLNYQLRLLAHYGLVAYGCCEPYTHKFDLLTKIPRLRRVSVSPWCDIEVAAEKLGDQVIFSWKPNPAMLVHPFDPDAIRAYLRRTLEVARGCVLEIILKDTFTLERDPARVETWARIAREEIEGGV